MVKRKRKLTQFEINEILFASDTDSELSSEDDGWPKTKRNCSFIPDPDSEEEIFIPDDTLTGDAANIQELTQENIFRWTETVDNNLITNCEKRYGGGPIHDLPVGSNAEEYFKLLFTEEMCENIKINTNSYAEYIKEHFKDKYEPIGDKKWKWIPIEDKQELWNFFSILIIMGIVKLPRLKDYWSSNTILGNDKIKEIMPRDRFLQIYKFLHLSDRSEELPQTHPDYYMLQKVNPFMDDLKKNFQKKFQHYTNISIDEAMIKYKGRLGIIQYMPQKPVKRGIKVWMMCSSFLGYISNFEVYCGKRDQMPRSGNGLGFDVVNHLSKYLERGSTIHFDRFFTTPVLIKHLLQKGISASGTVMTNRKNLPQNLKKIKLKNTGESKAFQCIEHPNITCTVWKDKKEIHMLSNCTQDTKTTVQRRIGGTKNTVPCPIVFAQYNKFMGGVDTADQYRRYYDMARKSRKWWIYLFWFFFNSAINNAFIIYSTSNFPLPKKPKKLLEFRMDIIEGLSQRYRKMQKMNYQSGHSKIKIEGRKKTCIRCRKLKIRTASNRQIESSWMCESCQVCLCVNCFGPYHDDILKHTI